MFDIQDGRFPLHSFDQYSEALIKLGLMVNTISTQLLVDRIYTVTQLNKSNYKKALDRSLAIKYNWLSLSDNGDLHHQVLLVQVCHAFLSFHLFASIRH
jgi:hypothetical protein